MAVKKISYDTDKNDKITQVNYVEDRPDGGTEIRHYNPLVTESRGKTVFNKDGTKDFFKNY